MSMVLWHAVTVMLAHLSLAYLWLARDPNAGLVHFTSAFQVGWSGLFIYYGLTIVGNLWVMPQWIGFLALRGSGRACTEVSPKENQSINNKKAGPEARFLLSCRLILAKFRASWPIGFGVFPILHERLQTRIRAFGQNDFCRDIEVATRAVSIW